MTPTYLGSIFSTKASGAEQIHGTNNSNEHNMGYAYQLAGGELGEFPPRFAFCIGNHNTKLSRIHWLTPHLLAWEVSQILSLTSLSFLLSKIFRNIFLGGFILENSSTTSFWNLFLIQANIFFTPVISLLCLRKTDDHIVLKISREWFEFLNFAGFLNRQ